jgi:hypothetical protein
MPFPVSFTDFRLLSPIFTVGIPKEGTSIMPLEEFPTTALQYCSELKYTRKI